MKIIKKGAEADIFLKNNKIIKIRNSESYRLPTIDKKFKKIKNKIRSKNNK